MTPELTDSRRLTGANLFWDLPAAIIDVCYAGDPQPLLAAWQQAAHSLLEIVGHSEQQLTHRIFQNGLSLLVSARIDQLYAMCELNEAAYACAAATLADQPLPDLALEGSRLKELFEEELDPRLLALQTAAARHGVPFLWDDDEASVGYGKTSLCWPRDKLPEISRVAWEQVKSIPVALVTGTNGKSTTVRMSAAIIGAAGIRAGLTSTDWIRIGSKILDEGDYSGTGGARRLLRHHDTEIAVLETARGGLLRRGLGVASASTALITNVAADHLGEYGIHSVAELIETKFIVRRALEGDAPLILNADDAGIVAFASQLELPKIWFSLDPANPVILTHRAQGGTMAVLQEDALCLCENGELREIVQASKIPSALGGTARYNLQNALGALALCSTLGISDACIRRGLESFRGDEHDNPGRGNWFEHNGVRILVDFAHNEHGTRAISEMVSSTPAERRLLLIGQAGDRRDEDIRAMTLAACRIQPDLVLACRLPGYERGRLQSEVLKVIRESVRKRGLNDEQIIEFEAPVNAAAFALDWARPGDVLVLLVLTQRKEVMRLIQEYIQR